MNSTVISINEIVFHMELSIVIPAGNASGRVDTILDTFLPFFTSRYGTEVEFIIVVGDSTGKASKQVCQRCETHPQIQLIDGEMNTSRADAFAKGLRLASGRMIGFIDANESISPESFKNAIATTDTPGVDGAVISYRFPRTQNTPQQSLLWRIASRMFDICIPGVFGLRCTDVLFCPKVFCREPLVNVLPRVNSANDFFEVGLLLQLERDGACIQGVPATWLDASKPRSTVGGTPADMLIALARLRLIHSPFAFLVRCYDRFFSRHVMLAGRANDRLLRHGVLMLFGSQASNMMNLAYQVVMMRMLTVQEYGTLAGMVQVLTWFTRPLGTIAITCSHFTAVFLKENQPGKAKTLLGLVVRHVAAAIMGALLAGIPFYYRYVLQTPRVGSMASLITVVTLCAMTLRPIVAGCLTGRQLFTALVAMGWTYSATRLAFAATLVALRFGAEGALTANLVAIVASLSTGTWFLRRTARGTPSSEPLARKPIFNYAVRYLIASIALAMLASTDIVIAKRLFGRLQGGHYAVAASVVRIAVFLPAPFTRVLFPKVADAEGKSNRRTLSKALLATVALVLPIMIVCALWPAFMLWAIRGKYTSEQVELLRILAVTVTPLPVITLLSMYELARRHFWVTYPLYIGVIAMAVSLYLRHTTPVDVALALGVGAYTTLTLLVTVLRFRSWSVATSARPTP